MFGLPAAATKVGSQSRPDTMAFSTLPAGTLQLKAILNLVGDHQMGTCRMGDDPNASVVNRFCRLHDAENVFVVDSSFMPTGLGLNPMVTTVANALRVGTHIVNSLRKGEVPGRV